MKKYLFTLLLFCITMLSGIPFASFGQIGMSLSKSTPSPDVAALETFGLIPANPFNGQANVSIPLYTVAYKELAIPITMQYATGGHKIEDHPGWLGLGWSLQSGGAIYRKVNGIYDEHPRQTPGVTYPDEICYYYNCGRVAANINNLDSIKKFAFDGASNEEKKKNSYDALPDEFVFNFNGYSGTFYITRPNANGAVELKVKPNGAYRLKAEIVEMKDYITFRDPIDDDLMGTGARTSSRSIYTIKITDDKGIQYVFGGNNKAIDFSNNGDLSQPFYTIASTWHLTEIISPAGYKLSLKYKRAGPVFTQQKQRNALFYDINFDFGSNTAVLFGNASGSWNYSGYMLNTTITVLSPVYLDSIITPLQAIKFTTSITKELDYPFDRVKLSNLAGTIYGREDAKSYWQKLDEINIGGVRRILFNYTNVVDRRLRLNGIDFRTATSEPLSSYRFQYDATLLPAYNSRKADHWGFFNGRAYDYDGNYLVNREPVAQYLQAEMLKTIYYPTGGFLTLEYEPHYYKKIARQFPFTVETQSSNILAGGLRAKKITAAPDSTSIPLVKEYLYIENYLNGGTASSGVLSGTPQYTNTGSRRDSYRTGNFWGGSWGSLTMKFGRIVDNNFLVLGNTNGNHVTYSEVTEKSGEGYIVYKYTNHDNGYNDKAPYITHTNFDTKWHEEGFQSLEQFRGNPIYTGYFDKNKKTIKDIVYEYSSDTSTSYFRVPYFYRDYDESMGGVPLMRVSTGVYFTRPILEKKQTETNYVPGTTQSFPVTKIYAYQTGGDPASDNFQVRVETTTNQAGKSLKATFDYPYDMVRNNTDPGGIYQEMINKNMVSPAIVQSAFKDTAQVELNKTNYYSPFTGQYLPQSLEKQIGRFPIETKLRFQQYDNIGNILTLEENGLKGGFQWSYNGQYQEAKVINAANITSLKEFFFEGFENKKDTGVAFGAAHTGLRYWKNNYTTTYAVPNARQYRIQWWNYTGSGWNFNEAAYTGSMVLTGPIDDVRIFPTDAQMTTYTYMPLIGITSECNEKGDVLYYEYDELDRLLLIRDKYRNVAKKYCYNYSTQMAGTCNVYYNDSAFTKRFNKNDCAICLQGTEVEYTVPKGIFLSTISQAEANSIAKKYLDANGQEYANLQGSCTRQDVFAQILIENQRTVSEGPDHNRTIGDVVIRFYSDAMFTTPVSVKNIMVNYRERYYYGCEDKETPYTVESDVSTIGNGTEVRMNDVLTQEARMYQGLYTVCFAKDFSLLPSICYYDKVYYNTEARQVFTRNNCAAGLSGSSVEYIVIARKYYSLVSQAQADNQALNDINTNGQAYANQTGACVYYNVVKSGIFTRNNCTSGWTGSAVTYTVPARKHSSIISQADADAKAQNDVNTNGQQYANINGTCSPPAYPYVKMELTNYRTVGTEQYADMILRFYADAGFTTPISVTNLRVNYKTITHVCEGGAIVNESSLNMLCNGTSTYTTVTMMIDNRIDPEDNECWWMEHVLLPGTGYFIGN